MIIYITAQGRAELREADEFRSFKIVVDTGLAPADLRRALAGFATLEPDGKTAWVGRDAVKRLHGANASSTWTASFDKMIESVRRFSWVNDQTGTVRAHIETAD
jgi:hypothetical protein